MTTPQSAHSVITEPSDVPTPNPMNPSIEETQQRLSSDPARGRGRDPSPSPQHDDRRKSSTAWVTLSVIVITCGVYLWMRNVHEHSAPFRFHELLSWGGNFYLKTTQGEWWRLLTSAFVHIDDPHLILNMISLFLLGREVERVFGHLNLLILYLGSAVVAGLCSIAWYDLRLSVGASGSIYGLFGGAISLFLLVGEHRVLAVRRKTLVIFGWILYTLFVSLFDDWVDRAGHLGGVLGGAVIGALLSMGIRRSRLRRSTLPRRPWRGFTVCILILGASITLRYLPESDNLTKFIRWYGQIEYRLKRTSSRLDEVSYSQGRALWLSQLKGPLLEAQKRLQMVTRRLNSFDHRDESEPEDTLLVTLERDSQLDGQPLSSTLPQWTIALIKRWTPAWLWHPEWSREMFEEQSVWAWELHSHHKFRDRAQRASDDGRSPMRATPTSSPPTALRHKRAQELEPIHSVSHDISFNILTSLERYMMTWRWSLLLRYGADSPPSWDRQIRAAHLDFISEIYYQLITERRTHHLLSYEWNEAMEIIERPDLWLSSTWGGWVLIRIALSQLYVHEVTPSTDSTLALVDKALGLCLSVGLHPYPSALTSLPLRLVWAGIALYRGALDSSERRLFQTPPEYRIIPLFKR